MTTKMSEALRYFEPVVQEVDRILTAFQDFDLQPDNRAYLVDLLSRLRKGWDVLGNQFVLTSHCTKCNDTHVLLFTDGQPPAPCPSCSVGISVDEQFAEIEQNRQWVADRLMEKEWKCDRCGQVNPTVPSRCSRCFTWRPCG